MNILEIAPLAVALLSLCGVIGGFLAMKAGYFQQAGTAQERAIDAMNAQIESQEKQIATCTRRIARLEQTLARVRKEMAKRGLQLEINGETITIVEQGGKRVSTVQIYLDEDKSEEKEA